MSIHAFEKYDGHSINKGKFLGTKSKINLFWFFFFFHKCKLCNIWNWFMIRCLFLGNSNWRRINMSASDLNRGLPSNLRRLTIANHAKFTMMYMEKHVLVKRKCLQMGYTWVFHQSKRKSMEWKSIDSSVRKIPGAVVYKEGNADSFLRYESTHLYWFPWKRCNSKQFILLSTPEAKLTLFID